MYSRVIEEWLNSEFFSFIINFIFFLIILFYSLVVLPIIYFYESYQLASKAVVVDVLLLNTSGCDWLWTYVVVKLVLHLWLCI